MIAQAHRMQRLQPATKIGLIIFNQTVSNYLNKKNCLTNHRKNQKVGLLCSTVVYSVVGDMDEVAIDLASFQVCPMEVFTGDTL